jgi:predicted enzyme related to lactoylglutathione lyase
MEATAMTLKLHSEACADPASPVAPALPAWQPALRSGGSRLTGLVLAAAVLAVTLITSVLAAPLPPLVVPASQEHHVGKVVWLQLLTPDLAVAKRFYGSLLGWEFRDLGSGAEAYAEASLDGQVLAGLAQKVVAAGERRQSAWLASLAVRDVDHARTVALAHGARVLVEPHERPDRGREAVFADPQGAVFAVLASSSGDPPDEMADPGEWIWSSLSTTDPDADAVFYQALFDFEVFDLPADQGARHLLLASDGYARASANSLPANRPRARPHWLNYVHVEDVVAMSARLVALGGSVLVEPRIDRHGGRVAIVADPLGAPFGLLEWPDDQTKAVAP